MENESEGSYVYGSAKYYKEQWENDIAKQDEEQRRKEDELACLESMLQRGYVINGRCRYLYLTGWNSPLVLIRKFKLRKTFLF